MTKAAESAVEFDNEEGVAQAAASLGPDGGPLATTKVSYDDETSLFGDDLDDSWLDEELSEEELAALSEEDFSDDELLAEELGLLEFDDDSDTLSDVEAAEPAVEDVAPAASPVEISDEVAEESAAEFDTDGSHNDFSLDDEFLSPEPDVIEEEIAAENDFDAGADEDPSLEEDLAEIPDDMALEAVADHAGDAAVSAATASLPKEVFDDGDTGFEVSEFEDEEVDHRPVPRIAIHAFCESPAITALLEKAAVDRRLSKSHLTIHMGGLSKAIDHFQSASTPNLILVEAGESTTELFAKLGELAEVCDPSTKVIIIGRVNDIALYRELMDQGISDYIVRPNSPLKIIKSIAELYIDPSAPPIGKTVAFVGARGGVGSSTIAHNVAWSTAEQFHSDTVILDLDLPFGTASLDFEQDPTSGLVEALSSPERLDDVLLDRLLQKHTDRLSLFTAPNLLDRDYDLEDQAFETVLDVVRGAAPTIVVDVPHVWTAWSKRILQTADEIVITAAPDLASFRNTKNLVDVISGARPNDSAPSLVLNQFDPKVSSVQSEQFVEHVGIEPLVTIGWEPQLFHTAATNASPIMEVGAKTKTADSLQKIAAHVLGREDNYTKKSKFSLSGLFKK